MGWWVTVWTSPTGAASAGDYGAAQSCPPCTTSTARTQAPYPAPTHPHELIRFFLGVLTSMWTTSIVVNRLRSFIFVIFLSTKVGLMTAKATHVDGRPDGE